MSEAAARYRQAKAIFQRVNERDVSERAAFLAEACGTDALLRAEVETLLADDRTRGAALDHIDHAHALPRLPPGYRIERELGRGGMGVVWLAERDSGDFKQRVALKLLGFDALRDPDRRARFRAERRILASLEHPNIARLIDGGTLADGTPFLAMEFVEGERLDVWAERARPQLRELLKLFVAICRAVQAAHSRLVVHRDLKPANILVDGYGAPKLLDFGIAKLLDDSVEVEVATGTGMQLLTPRYAAPEQVRGETITTATDVYALGVILYELLTGASPYGRAAATPDQLRAICDTEPVRPSQATRGDGATGTTSAAHLRGDLDAILLKCLRKEPPKRYRGAAELADDLESFLDGRPVTARAGSTRYAMGKFIGRHRYLVASAVVVFGVMVAALALTNWQLEKTRKQRDLTVQERDRAEAVTEYLVDVFEQATPLRHGGREPTVREALELGAKQLEQDRRLPEETRGVIETAMASVLQDLGDYDTAIAIAQRAVARFEAQAVRDPRRYAEALARRGSLRQEKGRYAEAAADFRLAIIALGRADPTATASLLNNMATVAMDRDRPEEGDRYRKQAIKLLLVLAGSETLEQAVNEVPPGEVAELLAVVAHNECGVLEVGGHYAEALRVCEATVTLKRRLFPDAPARWQGTLSVIGNVHSGRGDYAAAARAHGEALEISERVFGPRHPQVAIASLNLGVDLRQLGDIAGTRDAYQRAASIFTGSQGPEHRYTLIARNNLANLEIDAGNFAKGLAEHRAIMDIRRRVLGADAPELAQSLSNIANALSGMGDEHGSIAATREAMKLLQRVRSEDHPDLGYARLDLAQRLVKRGQHEEALALLELAYACFAGAGDNALARAHIDFLRAQARIDEPGQHENSIALARGALAVAQQQPDNDRIDPVEVREWLREHGASPAP